MRSAPAASSVAAASVSRQRVRRPVRSETNQPSAALRASACRAALASMPSTPSTPTNVPVQTHPPAGSKNSPSTVTNSERALGAPSSSGRRPAAPGPPADPVVATAAIAAASPLRSLLLRSRRSISTRWRPPAAAPVPPRTRSGGTMLDGLALVDAHLHAARLPTLKVSMPEWAPFPAVPMDELYSADGTLRPAAYDDHLAVQGVDVALLLAEYSPRVIGLQTVEDLLPVIEHNPARFRLVGNINPYFHHPVDEEVARQTAYAGYIARSLAGKRPCTGCTLSATAPSSACRATSSSTGWWKYGLILPTSRNRAGLYSITGSRSSTVCRPVTRGLYSAISSATSTPWTARWSSNAAGRSVPSAE